MVASTCNRQPGQMVVIFALALLRSSARRARDGDGDAAEQLAGERNLRSTASVAVERRPATPSSARAVGCELGVRSVCPDQPGAVDVRYCTSDSLGSRRPARAGVDDGSQGTIRDRLLLGGMVPMSILDFMRRHSDGQHAGTSPRGCSWGRYRPRSHATLGVDAIRRASTPRPSSTSRSGLRGVSVGVHRRHDRRGTDPYWGQGRLLASTRDCIIGG